MFSTVDCAKIPINLHCVCFIPSWYMMNRKVDSDWRKVRMEYVYVYQFQPYKGAFTLTLAEHPVSSLRPSSWPSCVYTTSEAVRGHGHFGLERAESFFFFFNIASWLISFFLFFFIIKKTKWYNTYITIQYNTMHITKATTTWLWVTGFLA